MDHETALLTAQAKVDAARNELDRALSERAARMHAAYLDGVTKYRIARVLGLADNAIRQAIKAHTKATATKVTEAAK